ncbi:MAG: hypothetical protein FJ102_19450 [Deltaproteobacteria bacterium]|nr:hypothetical protein [Deltaproteobacteria bacterium]
MPGRRMIGEILVQEAIVSPESLRRALDEQRSRAGRRRVGEVLVDNGALQPRALVEALGMQADVPVVEPLSMPVHPPSLWRVPRDVAERYCAILLEGEEGPLLAMGDPNMQQAIRQVATYLGVTSLPVAVAAPDEILASIARHYDLVPARARTIKGLTPDERPPLLSPTGQELDTRVMLGRLAKGPGKPLHDFVTALLCHAFESGAERVVIDAGVVQYVYDGVATEILDLPAVHAAGVVSRLRVVLRLEPSLNKVVSGRWDLQLGQTILRVKVVATPGSAGGQVTLDLADSVSRGDNPLALARKVDTTWAELAVKPGLVILAGPEGSGLRAVAASVPGAFYVPLRDAGAVEAAASAAERGRTVLGRVVAPTIPEALARLRDLAPAAWAVANVLTGAITTRRLRRVCATCCQPGEITPACADRLGVMPFSAPIAGFGCPACGYRGYRGSVHAAELVVANDELRDALETGVPLRELGMLSRPVADRSIQVDAAARAIAGQTTIYELERCVPSKAPWAHRPPEERHRGLLRAVTQPPPEMQEEDASDAPTAPPGRERPLVHVVHPGVAERATLRSRLEGRCDLHFSWASTLAQAEEETTVMVIAHGAPGGWNPAQIADLRQAGCKVVLLGPGGDLGKMAEAFALGADDYAGGIEELALRLGRWLPERSMAASASK